MVANPSHLEFVNPVVEGMARAAMSQVDQPGAAPARRSPRAAHPDSRRRLVPRPGRSWPRRSTCKTRKGFRTGGTVHIIANNQVGFTALREEVCSTLYVSDLAKGFKIPVIHVNADDPEACIEAARIAYAYTHEFERDFLIDLVGYRRYGHNEGDDPTFTQPLMYKLIEKHPSVRTLWAGEMAKHGVAAGGRARRDAAGAAGRAAAGGGRAAARAGRGRCAAGAAAARGGEARTKRQSQPRTARR